MIQLSAGPIEYQDTGGDGPVVVLLHGLLMDATLWAGTLAELAADHRCVVPTLPLGAHRHALAPSADLSLPGIARGVGELLERLDLREVTLVGNDTGGALAQLVVGWNNPRVARVVLVSCEAFDNLPGGLTGRTVGLVGKLSPTLFGMFMQQLRVRAIRRLPISFGWLTLRGDPATAGWMVPVQTRPEIRRDAVRVLRAITADPGVLLDAADRLPSFGGPALVVWARGDRVMPPEHGRRLAALFTDGRLVEVDDSYTLVPLDQPVRLAQLIRDFVATPIAQAGPWLPADWSHPTRVELPTGQHLRPIRAADAPIDHPAVMGSRERLWSIYGDAWGWPPATMTFEQDREDLARHEREIDNHESFNYALFDDDESALLGCVYLDPPAKPGADAEISWWVVDALVGSDVEAALDALVPDWVARDWPLVRPRYVGRDLSWADWLTLPDIV